MKTLTKFNDEHKELFEELLMTNENQIDEGKISKTIKKFWKWLFGGESKSEKNEYKYSYSNLGDINDIPTTDDGKIDKRHITKYMPFDSKYKDTPMTLIKKFIDNQPGKFKFTEELLYKNNDHFPYIDDNNIKMGCIFCTNKENNKQTPIAIIVYAFSKHCKELHENHDDHEPESSYAYIYCVEVIDEARGHKLSKELINGVCNTLLKNNEKGVTLYARNDKIVNLYIEYGFRVYDDYNKYMSKSLTK